MISYTESPAHQPGEGRMPVQEKMSMAIAQMNKVLLGKDVQVKHAICCVIAGGHLLIEDLPGLGKTSLAQVLAKVLGLGSQRVQFTSDLLPSDILGVSIFDQETKRFRFVAGPVFTHILIADEINRTTPKTQSALLEAMAEGNVTIEGTKRKLPQPFFVVATQNPKDQVGTYALPESQMDRFMMRISMGYPHEDAERKLLMDDQSIQGLIAKAPAIFDAEEVRLLQQRVLEVKTQQSLIDYIQRLLLFTREDKVYQYGISPRGGLSLLHAAKAWALMDGRKHVLPEDVQYVMPSVWGHRLTSKSQKHSRRQLLAHLLQSVPVVA